MQARRSAAPPTGVLARVKAAWAELRTSRKRSSTRPRGTAGPHGHVDAGKIHVGSMAVGECRRPRRAHVNDATWLYHLQLHHDSVRLLAKAQDLLLPSS
jgi:hypothetical protein